ncbi:MAG: diacylglycerol kinase [Duodenibacillus sp.]|nr:diacylglycerol kinase [Duodenibacillus sp.]
MNQNESAARDAKDLKGKTGLTRLINAARYSRDGIAATMRTEEAFRQELVLGCLLVPAALFLPVSLELRLLCVFSVFFTLVVELLNSGIEACIDRIGPEIHPLSKVAKDVGSAAVLLSLAFGGIVWTSALIQCFI